jgi:hypothetical protein
MHDASHVIAVVYPPDPIAIRRLSLRTPPELRGKGNNSGAVCLFIVLMAGWVG